MAGTVLGPLCKRGHDHEGSGGSLRYASTRQCVACMKERQATYGKAYNAENAEHRREYARQYHHENRDTVLQRMADYRKTAAFHESYLRHVRANRGKQRERCREWRNENRPRVSAYNRAYDAARPEYTKERRRKWSQSERGRLIQVATRNRKRATRAGVLSLPYTAEELKARRTLFAFSCAYCGSRDRLCFDHFVPLSKGGADALANLVVACKRCNDRKSDRDGWQWYRAQLFHRPSREEVIRRVLAGEEADLTRQV